MKALKRILIGIVALGFLALLVGFNLLPMAFKAKYEGSMVKTRDGKGLMTFVRLPDGDGSFPTVARQRQSPFTLNKTKCTFRRSRIQISKRITRATERIYP